MVPHTIIIINIIRLVTILPLMVNGVTVTSSNKPELFPTLLQRTAKDSITNGHFTQNPPQGTKLTIIMTELKSMVPPIMVMRLRQTRPTVTTIMALPLTEPSTTTRTIRDQQLTLPLTSHINTINITRHLPLPLLTLLPPA